MKYIYSILTKDGRTVFYLYDNGYRRIITQKKASELEESGIYYKARGEEMKSFDISMVPFDCHRKESTVHDCSLDEVKEYLKLDQNIDEELIDEISNLEVGKEVWAGKDGCFEYWVKRCN